VQTLVRNEKCQISFYIFTSKYMIQAFFEKIRAPRWLRQKYFQIYNVLGGTIQCILINRK